MKYALFSVPVGTIYDLPQTIKEGEAGLVSTIGDEGLYGQACQVRTARRSCGSIWGRISFSWAALRMSSACPRCRASG